MIKKMSQNVASWVVKDLDISALQASAIRYGLESALGALIETFVVFLFAYLIGTFKYAMFLMIPSFFYRMFADGPHCSSYNRCFVFTFTIYSLLSLITKHVFVYSSSAWLLILILFSIFFMISSYSNKLIKNISATVLYLLCTSTIFILCWRLNIYRELVFAGIVGLFLQAFISTQTGYKTVKLFDSILKYIKIN